MTKATPVLPAPRAPRRLRPDTSSEGSGAAVEQLINEGTEADPPSESPAPAKGKTVWWVSCGAVAPDCAIPLEAAKEAAGELGMTLKSADGKLNQAGGYLSAMRTALAQKPDALILHALDCTSVKPAIAEANEAGIPILPIEMSDCDAPPVNGEAVLEHDMQYAPDIPDTTAWFKAGAPRRRCTSSRSPTARPRSSSTRAPTRCSR